jgi:hypothetical protein
MNAGVSKRYKSSIHPLLRYGLAFCAACSAMLFWAVYTAAVVAMFSWLIKDGAPDTVTIYGAFLLFGVFLFLFCVLVSQLLRISPLGRWWFGTRIPAIIAILLGCTIYFAVICMALNDTPINRVFPSYNPITVSLIAIALFTFGFMQFPFFRSRSRFSGNPASALA